MKAKQRNLTCAQYKNTAIKQRTQDLCMVYVSEMVNKFVAIASVTLHGQKMPVIARKIQKNAEIQTRQIQFVAGMELVNVTSVNVTMTQMDNTQAFLA